MLDEHQVVVYKTNDSLQAEIVKNALESQGIHCGIDGEGQAGMTNVLEIRITVLAEDEKTAREIIAGGIA